MNNSTNHSNFQKLRAIYADLTRIGEFAADDMVLHKADREFCGDAKGGRALGREAAVAHERELIRSTDGTLVMDVERIVANDHFGAVFGVLRAYRGRATLAVPFCGLWRFRDGFITTHWENAYDLAPFAAFVAEKAA